MTREQLFARLRQVARDEDDGLLLLLFAIHDDLNAAQSGTVEDKVAALRRLRDLLPNLAKLPDRMEDPAEREEACRLVNTLRVIVRAALPVEET
jgi:hypothetical protein